MNNIADMVIEKVNTVLDKSESAQIIISKTPLNFSFFVIWNEQTQDYFNMSIQLQPIQTAVYDKNKDVLEIINTFFSEYMNSNVHVAKEHIIYLYDDNIYKMTISATKIVKKSIMFLNMKHKKNNMIDQKILFLLQDAGSKGMTISEITQKTQTITKEERYTILNTFINDGIITLRGDCTNGRTRNIYYYE